MIKSLSLTLLSLVLFTACSSAPARQTSTCASVDWWEMGRTDGVAGLTLEKGLKQYSGQCGLDRDAYSNGRDAGLIDYCTPQQGLAAGLSGATYLAVCPTHLEQAFLTQYEIGQRQRALEVKRAEAGSDKPQSASF